MKHALLIAIATLLLTGCTNNVTTNTSTAEDSTILSATPTIKSDSIILKPAYHEEDIVVNEYAQEMLLPIRQNFKRINSMNSWDKIDTAELHVSTEGGYVTFYYTHDTLQKIIAHAYGETGRSLEEYYFLNNDISFVLEQQYHYNRPIYYDSAAMSENNDNEVFDMEDTEIEETRSYFDNGKLVYRFESGDCGGLFAKEYLKEEELRIHKMLDKLMTLHHDLKPQKP